MTSIIFLGTPNFAVPILKALSDSNYEIKAVVTQPDKKVGRKQKLTQSPVKELAEKLNLPVFQPAKLSKSEELNQLVEMHADLVITAAYGQFYPLNFCNQLKLLLLMFMVHFCLNIAEEHQFNMLLLTVTKNRRNYYGNG
ncbi:formyltransferase family protein [Lactobacillus sp. R2/2]|nr:formyltransferase family protein [Lactobacillus sp. R2/2]